jgi:dihydrofolate reductase
MGKIIASASVTLDGIFSGPKGDEDNMISWALPGVQDSGSDNLHLFQQADAILMGRVRYEGLSSFWPTQAGEWVMP